MTVDLQTWLTGNVFAWLLVFTRVGTAFITLPGVGEAFVAQRVRLLLALFVSLLLVPVLSSRLPPMPTATPALVLLIAGEAFYGAFIGLVARLIVVAVETAGMIIAMQISLSNASVFNPSMSSQGSQVGALLGMTALILLFATNLHHLLLLAVADSYTVFLPGTVPVYGDFANTYGKLMDESFAIGAQLAAPFIVMGLVFYLGLGLLSRLMPQLQIFFVAIPAQIYLGLALLGMFMSTLMLVWLTYAQTTVQGFLDLN